MYLFALFYILFVKGEYNICLKSATETEVQGLPLPSLIDSFQGSYLDTIHVCQSH
jgi:hypothetical protein